MDFRLTVFISVARHLNFTRAADELRISQPAISRHIHELESAYKVQLFERTGNKVALTAAGEVFLKHAESILENYKALQVEMNLLSGNFSGELHVGASTTIAQYVLPPVIAKFISRFPDVKLTVTSGNSVQIEQALEEHRIDVGLIEGRHRNMSLRYIPFAKDELVLVTSVLNKVAEEMSLEELRLLPLVLRENGSGTLEVIEEALNAHGIKLSQMNVLLQLGSTESIKLFLANSPMVYAILSITSVTKELMNNVLKVVDVAGLDLEREFAVALPHGSHNDIRERFIRFMVQSL